MKQIERKIDRYGDGIMLGIVKGFMLQLSFIAILIFVYQIFLRHRFTSSRSARLLYACLFGLSILLCITFRVEIATNFWLDLRIIPLLLGTLYGGWEMGLFLSGVIILYRLFLGADLGFDTTVLALAFSMPVIIYFQRRFMKADKNRKVFIASMLSIYYILGGVASVYFVGRFSYRAADAAVIQIVLSVLFVSLFVLMNEMIQAMLIRNQQLQAEVKEAEIAFLRAQIKPHFLYNALNSISALCDVDPKHAGDVTEELAHYLRGRFDFASMESSVSLKKELEYVSSYINVERARFGEKLQVEYQIDNNLDLWIPPLIVQPIVENAVKHGLQDRRAGGLVKIVVEQAGSDAEIRISDNGKGMEPEKIHQANHRSDTPGVGLRNVDVRLKKRYGRGLSIVSEPGKGTTVIMRIPVVAQA